MESEETANEEVTEAFDGSAYGIEDEDGGEGTRYVMEVDDTGDGIGNESEEEGTWDSKEKQKKGSPSKVVSEFFLISLDCCTTHGGKNGLGDGYADGAHDDRLDVACVGVDGDGSGGKRGSEGIENEETDL